MFQLSESVSSLEQEQVCGQEHFPDKESRYNFAPVKCVTLVKVLDSYELCIFPLKYTGENFVRFTMAII